MPRGMYEVYTYVHIPTGYVAQTCHNISNELTLQRQVLFYGAPWIEWEKIKTEWVGYESPLIQELMTANAFEMRNYEAY